MARVGVCSVAVCCLALAGTVYAQQPERAISTVPNLDYAYSNLPTQPVGPDDLLALSVYDSPELTRTVRVDADGNIRLPMLKDPIQVRGMVPSQLESAIAKALTKGNVLVDPIVTVTIVEYQSRPVNVVGAVKNPLVFQATRPIPLLDAIARAGGMREDAGSDIVVSKEVMRDGKPARITQTIPVRKLIDNADPALNVMLHGGEEVLVPEALKIYVVGNVKKPGAYPVRNDEETTILQLLALSEGLTPYSAKVAYVYRRSPGGSQDGSARPAGEDHEAPIARRAPAGQRHTLHSGQQRKTSHGRNLGPDRWVRDRNRYRLHYLALRLALCVKKRSRSQMRER